MELANPPSVIIRMLTQVVHGRGMRRRTRATERKYIDGGGGGEEGKGGRWLPLVLIQWCGMSRSLLASVHSFIRIIYIVRWWSSTAVLIKCQSPMLPFPIFISSFNPFVLYNYCKRKRYWVVWFVATLFSSCAHYRYNVHLYGSIPSSTAQTLSLIHWIFS